MASSASAISLLEAGAALGAWGDEMASPSGPAPTAATATASRKRRLSTAEAPERGAAGPPSASAGGGAGGAGAAAAHPDRSGGGSTAGSAAAPARHPRYHPDTARLGCFNPDTALASARGITDGALLATLIASTLRESQTAMVENSVKTLGVVACRELLVATVETEADGGLMTADGSRRRSPGGVFFELMKQVASAAQYKEIFAQRVKEKNTRQNKMRRLSMKE